MANFKAWVETTKAGNFRVRYRDGSRNEKGKFKKFTKVSIDSKDRVVIEGKTFVGKSLAHRHMEKLIEAYHRNELGSCDLSVPLLPLIERYVSECENNGLAWMTYQHYEEVLTKIVKRYEIVSILDLCTKLSEYKEKASLKLKKSTIAGEMVIVFVFCRWLMEHGFMKVWPFKSHMIPSVKRASPKCYTHEEFLALDVALDDPMARLAFNLAYYGALRKVEIVGDGRERLGVLWEDLSWNPDGSALLNIRGEVAKGGKKSGQVPLTREVVEMLGSRKSGPIITLGRNRLWYLFFKARKKAGLNPKLTIHGLRHSCATNLLEHGNMALSGVQKFLRHSSITTTMIYAHHEKSYLAEGAEKVREKLNTQEAIRGQVRGKSIELNTQPWTDLDNSALQSRK